MYEFGVVMACLRAGVWGTVWRGPGEIFGAAVAPIAYRKDRPTIRPRE